jgi:hypothetical protein
MRPEKRAFLRCAAAQVFRHRVLLGLGDGLGWRGPGEERRTLAALIAAEEASAGLSGAPAPHDLPGLRLRLAALDAGPHEGPAGAPP